MTLQEATMPYVNCPTAVINTRVDVAWALLMNPAAWGGVFDMRVGSIDPPGPAVVGQKISGETGLRILHLKLTLRMIEIDPHQRRLCLDVHLPFGITVHEDLSCTPLDVDHCRVDYRCDFDFPRGWRGSLAKVLIHHGFDSGPEDSLSRLKHAAERDAARGSGELRYEDSEPVMIDPSPELPDDTLIESVELPPKVKDTLVTAGLKTVGDIRETPDSKILQIQNLGKSTLALLRETLGLPSSLGVRSDVIQKEAKSED